MKKTTYIWSLLLIKPMMGLMEEMLKDPTDIHGRDAQIGRLYERIR